MTAQKEVRTVLEILRKFFRFCDERERSEFYRSIVLGVLAALFSALKIPAIGVMLQAILVEGVTAKTILLSLAVMLISVIGSSILKYRATALQTDGGYSTTANKRVQIAEHLRYLPMGYFNENSLGAITSVTTNTMDNLSGVSTRVVMLVTEGIFSTAVMTLAVFLFDWRVGLFIIAGLAVYYAVNHALQIRSEQTTRRKFAGDTAVVEQVLEFIKGIAEVKSYSLIGRYNRRLEDTIEENVNANTDMELKLLPLMLTQNVVAKLIDMGVVVLSLILYTGGRMELLNCVMLCICSFLLTEGLEAHSPAFCGWWIPAWIRQRTFWICPPWIFPARNLRRSTMIFMQITLRFPMAKSRLSTESRWTFRSGQRRPSSGLPAAERPRSAICSPASGMWMPDRSRWAATLCASTTWTA